MDLNEKIKNATECGEESSETLNSGEIIILTLCLFCALLSLLLVYVDILRENSLVLKKRRKVKESPNTIGQLFYTPEDPELPSYENYFPHQPSTHTHSIR